MKVSEILNEGAPAKSLADLVARLEKVGGKTYAEIAKGNEKGFLGVNGTGKTKVYFAFYPDGTSQRFEKPVEEKDLKPGFKVVGGDTRDPEAIAKDKAAQDKLKKAQQREAAYTEEIRLSDAELIKVCKAHGISFGPIVDAYPESLHGRAYGTEYVGDREVAYVEYAITTENEDYTPDGENGPEHHDPFYVKIWRDPKNPERLKAEQTD